MTCPACGEQHPPIECLVQALFGCGAEVFFAGLVGELRPRDLTKEEAKVTPCKKCGGDLSYDEWLEYAFCESCGMAAGGL